MPHQDEKPPDDTPREALQARVNLHQAILKEYRTRGYQMVLAHAGLALAAGKYAAARTGTEATTVALAMTALTLFLWTWLDRLREKSDGHRDDALELYSRLGVSLPRDPEHGQSRHRLWGPLVAFPWAVIAGLWIWLLGANLPALCQMLQTPRP